MPRVFHLGGECGYHAKKHNCDVNHVTNSVHAMISKWESQLHPNSLRLAPMNKAFPKNFKGLISRSCVKYKRANNDYLREKIMLKNEVSKSCVKALQ